MSVPPLVCSTPPPLEQVDCEDINNDDYPVHYQLSQEEDEFYSYPDFEPTPLPVCEEPHIDSESNAPLPIYNEIDANVTLNSECDNKCGKKLSKNLKLDEDNNIEDLDLKYEPTAVALEVTEKVDNVGDTSSDVDIRLTNIADIRTETDYSEKSHESIKDTSKETSSFSNLNDNSSEDNGVDINEIVSKSKSETELEIHIKDQPEINFKIDAANDIKNVEKIDSTGSLEHSPQNEEFGDFVVTNSKSNHENSSFEEEGLTDFNFEPTDINLEKEVLGNLGLNEISKEEKKEVLSDFDDFDAFQSRDTKVESVHNVLESNEFNPWQNDEPIVNDFSDFQATFDNSPGFNTAFKEISEDQSTHSIQIQHQNDGKNSSPNLYNDDDDFGDFDDFQSSSKSDAATNKQPNSMSLNINDSESQLYESIEKSIHSIYLDKFPEDEQIAENKLESSLGVTWHHLTEIEVRQPYMVQWNNSTSQKALLKALYIDSRNILFGPKWSNSNTPRYAANLNTAPLQPTVKPVCSKTSSSNPETEADKQKANAWTDKVSSDGQESCPDDNNEQPTMNATSLPYQDDILKPTKVFSSTLPLQPLRQISLPDTHIYTPTDSEEPRSKTIHYDNCTSAVLPHEKVAIDVKNVPNDLSDDFDDFQDFQGCAAKLPDNLTVKDNSERASTNNLPPFVGGPSFQTQTILEPIKLEPTMPVLNWPEPGDVKETFEDFTDFVSSPAWENVNSKSLQNTETKKTEEIKNNVVKSDLASGSMNSLDGNNSHVEDDFDNFKFVQMPALTKSTANFASKTQSATNPLSDIKLPTDSCIFEIKSKPELPSSTFSQNTIINPKPAPFTSTALVSEILQPMKPLHSMPSTSIPSNQILQPVTVEKTNSSPEKSNSKQILQPLSLESFSQINWPDPGMDLQDLSKFNPINAVHSLHNSPNKSAPQSKNHADDDAWGEFVSIKPSKSSQPTAKVQAAAKPTDDDWSDFVSNVTPVSNGVNTISFNVHTNSSQKSTMKPKEDPQTPLPSLNYITPKSNQRIVKDKQFQNL